MILRYSLLFILFLFSINIYAQDKTLFPSEIWHEGEVVLMSRDTLKGSIKYDFDNDLVLFNRGGNLYSYGARKVLSFRILDITTETYRDFFAVPFPVRANYKIPVFFEVLFEGPLTLLARENIVEKQEINQGYYNQPFYNTGEVTRKLVKHFFYLDMEGGIYRHTMKRKDLFRLMRDKYSKVRQYYKKNRLQINNEKDLIRIVAYYTKLLEEEPSHGKK